MNNGSSSSLQCSAAPNKNNKFSPLYFQMQTELNFSRKQQEPTANNQSSDKTQQTPRCSRTGQLQELLQCPWARGTEELWAATLAADISPSDGWLSAWLPALSNPMQVEARVAQGCSVGTAIFWWWHFIENSHGSRDSRKHKWVYIPAPPSNFLLLISKHLAKEISTNILVQCTTFSRIWKRLNSLFLFYTHF